MQILINIMLIGGCIMFMIPYIRGVKGTSIHEKLEGHLDAFFTVPNASAWHAIPRLSILRRFIEQASVAGKEEQMQNIMTSYFKNLGANELYMVPMNKKVTTHKAFASPHTSFNATNVIGMTPKNEGTGKTLLFNAHVDVVPAEDPKQFVPRIEGDHFIGRGTTDMKGGMFAVGLALEAVQKALEKTEHHLTNRVVLMSVIEEESGGAGSLACCLNEPLTKMKIDGAIIPEPTEFKLFPSQQGSMWFRVRITGIAAHGATRYNGVSAIEKIPIVLAAIQQLEAERTEHVRKTLDIYPDSIPIPVPINVGVVRGGKWPSSCPDEVVLEGRMGVIPGETLDSARQQLISALSSLQDPFLQKHPVNVTFYGAAWPPGHLSKDHQLVDSLKQFVPTAQERGHTEDSDHIIVEAAPWATDAGYMGQYCHIPTVVYGPGVTKVAHAANEYISITSLRAYARSMASFIIDWVGIAPNTQHDDL